MKRPSTIGAGRASNVIPLRPGIERAPSPFDRLTARLVLARHREGTLPEGVLVALLAGAGLAQ